MNTDRPENRTTKLEQLAAGGDAEALAEFFELHRDRLSRMISFRMDRRVQGRIDTADVLQDSCVEAVSRLNDYARGEDRMPLFLWLRTIAFQKLLELHRHHLERQKRDAKREVSIDQPANSGATSAFLAARLVGQLSTPSRKAMREELRARIESALDELQEMDCEVLALRHFEQLTAAEAARVLQIEESAASKRYLRAVRRLGTILQGDGRVG
ncbi:MAG: sigma-70 family RNA polymerase sigma factor [Planctomycetota bacterium]